MVRQLAVILSAFVLVWYALNVPAEQVRREATTSHGKIVSREGADANLIGGFPWKYCEFSYDRASSGSRNTQNRRYRFRSNKVLCWNIAVGFLIAGVLTALILLADQRRKKREDEKQSGAMRISLAGLLGLVTLFAGAFGYYRIGIQRLTDDLTAFNHHGGRGIAQQHAPKWLAALIDPSFVMEVERGTVNRSDCTDAQFQRIAGMRSLTEINVRGASSDEVCTLASLPKLRSLSIEACTLTDEMLEAIGNNSQIWELSLAELEAPPTEAQIARLHEIISASNNAWRLTLPVFAKSDLHIENLPQLTSLSLVLSPSTNVRRIASEPNKNIETQEFLDNQTVLDRKMLEALVRQQIESESNRLLNLQTLNAPEPIDKYLLGSVTLANLQSLPYLHLDFPLRNLTIRNVPELRSLDLQAAVHDELTLENLPALTAVSFRQTKTPAKLTLKDLPNLFPTGKHEKGIEFGGLVTKTMVDQLGDYAPALVGTRLSRTGLPQQMTLEAFAALLPQTRARRLSFGDIRFHPTLETNADFSALPNLENIESFQVTDFPWGNIPGIPAAVFAKAQAEAQDRPIHPGYELLAKLPNLRELRVANDFTDEHARYLKSMTKLEILFLERSQMTDEGWEQLPEQPNLRAFSAPEKLTHLQLRNMPKLEWLRIPHTTLKSLELENLPSLGTKLHIHRESQLEHVSIKNVREVDLELERLPMEFETSDTALTYVIANGEWLTDDKLQQFVSPETKKLDISSSLVTSKSIDRLVSLKKLQLLDASYTKLNEEDIKRLLDEANLKPLRAATVDLSDETLDALPEGNIPALAPGFRWGFAPPTLDDKTP